MSCNKINGKGKGCKVTANMLTELSSLCKLLADDKITTLIRVRSAILVRNVSTKLHPMA